MRRIVAGAALALTLAGGLPGPLPASNTAFEKGRHCYEQKQFEQAAAFFAEAARSEPRNVSAYLYEANSLYALGKRSAAASWYKIILQRFPESPQCATALSYLKMIDPSTAGSSTSGKTASSDSASTTKAPARDADVRDFDIMSMIVVVRPQGQHPYCTSEFIQSVKTALKQMPRNVVIFCAGKGCKIYVTPTLIDYSPDLLNSRPRGYEQGHTYKNVPAMYDGKGVVVCQYALKGESGTEWEPTDDPIGSLRHEFGHCLDHNLGEISESQEFRHIYYLDRGQMDPDTKVELHYYVQEGESTGGPSESFAQACCIIFGGGTTTWRQKQDQAFGRSFTGVIAYIRNKMKEIHN